MVGFLEEKLGNAWAPLRRRRVRISFSGEQMEEGIDTRLADVWDQREAYVNQHAEKVLHHLKTPIMGENIDAMIFSDNEGEEEEEEEVDEDDVMDL